MSSESGALLNANQEAQAGLIRYHRYDLIIFSAQPFTTHLNVVQVTDHAVGVVLLQSRVVRAPIVIICFWTASER